MKVIKFILILLLIFFVNCSTANKKQDHKHIKIIKDNQIYITHEYIYINEKTIMFFDIQSHKYIYLKEPYKIEE